VEKKKKILVVDDEPSVTFTLSGVLKRLGPDYEMIRAFTKEEALKAVKDNKPNVVLLDIDLSGVNAGLEILQELNSKYKEIKPIVITGHAKDMREDIEKIGCFYFFEKPVNLRKLNVKIKDALGIEKIVEHKEHIVSKEIPEAKLLFIEPNIYLYAYLCSMFDIKEMISGTDFTVKVLDDINNILNVMSTYRPDIVLIGDYTFEDDQLLSLVDLVLTNIKVKPDVVIIHGLFERHDLLEVKLKRKGVLRCVQNVLDNEQIMTMNKILVDFVSRTCIDKGMIKKEVKAKK